MDLVLLLDCTHCPAGTEPAVGFEYKWWNTLPSNMETTVLSGINFEYKGLTGDCLSPLTLCRHSWHSHGKSSIPLKVLLLPADMLPLLSFRDRMALGKTWTSQSGWFSTQEAGAVLQI